MRDHRLGLGRGEIGRRVAEVIHASPRTRNEPERPRAGGRDRDRHPRRLHARRANARLVHREVGALVRDGRLAEQAIEQLDELVEASRRSCVGRQRLGAEHGRVESDAARADAEDESSAGDVIGGHRVLARASRDGACSATRPSCRARRGWSRRRCP